MASNLGSLDLIINTVPIYHDYSVYTPLLSKTSRIGKQVLLGLHEGIVSGFALTAVTFGRSRIAASGIGGIAATQAVIDLCAKNKIYPEVEVVGCEKLNKVYQQLNDSNDEGKRYVLDLGTLKEGVVCEDPPPVLDPVKGMSPRSILATVMRDLFTARWW
jgi:D-arabinose 1-dehydrogenase-like Zn-dependent alcohol dehydrogenase